MRKEVDISRALGKLRPLREVSPDLARFAEERGISVDEERWPRVFAMRGQAREIVATMPEVVWTDIVHLDFSGVAVASPSFIDELLKAWPLAVPNGMNEDVQASWDLVKERHDKS